MAFMEIKLAGYTEELTFESLVTTDNKIEFIDSDIGSPIDKLSLNGNTITITEPPSEDFWVELQGNFTQFKFVGNNDYYNDSVVNVHITNNEHLTDMSYMFKNCRMLESVSIGDEMSIVTNADSMFEGCEKLSGVSYNSLNTSNVLSMINMFKGCRSLDSAPKMDTSKITDMTNMFYGCSLLTTIPLYDTSNVTNMYSMFYDCSALINIPKLNTSKVTDMRGMFNRCMHLRSIPELDTSKVTNMSGMFRYTLLLNTIPPLNIANVISMDTIFMNSDIRSIPELDVSNISSMARAFDRCTQLNSLKLKGLKLDLDLTTSQYIDKESVDFILNNVQKVNNKTIKFNEKSIGYKSLTALSESYINAINNGWTIIPEIVSDTPFKVVYADSLEKYNQLNNPDMNTMYIIGEGDNKMIIFNNKVVSNKGTKIKRI